MKTIILQNFTSNFTFCDYMFWSTKSFCDVRLVSMFCDGFCFVTIHSVTLTVSDTYIMYHKRLMTRHFVTLSYCDLIDDM